MCQRRLGDAPHAIHIAQRVRRGDGAVVIRIVDDRRKTNSVVLMMASSSLSWYTPASSDVSVPIQQIRIIHGGQTAQNLCQIPRIQFGRGTPHTQPSSLSESSSSSSASNPFSLHVCSGHVSHRFSLNYTSRCRNLRFFKSLANLA